jgi:hypothetical protein
MVVKSISHEAYAATVVVACCVILPIRVCRLVGALSALCAYVALESGR